MQSLDMKIEFPITVHVDNIGTIFMAENATATARTRHIDARYHFVREYVEDGHIRVKFVRTGENQSDGFTKNVTPDVYMNHTKFYLQEQSDFLK